VEYCDERCLFVYNSLHAYIRISQELHVQTMHVTYGRGSDFLWQCCNTFFTSGFVNDDIVLALIARNRQQKGHISLIK